MSGILAKLETYTFQSFHRPNCINAVQTEIFSQLKLTHVPHVLEQGAIVAPVITVDATVVVTLPGKFLDIAFLKIMGGFPRRLVGRSSKTFGDPFG